MSSENKESRSRSNGFSNKLTRFSEKTNVRLHDPRNSPTEFLNVNSLNLQPNKSHTNPPVFSQNHPFVQYSKEHNLVSTNENKRRAKREERLGLNQSNKSRFYQLREKNPKFLKFIRDLIKQEHQKEYESFMTYFFAGVLQDFKRMYPEVSEDQLIEFIKKEYYDKTELIAEKKVHEILKRLPANSPWTYNPSLAQSVAEIHHQKVLTQNTNNPFAKRGGRLTRSNQRLKVKLSKKTRSIKRPGSLLRYSRKRC